MPQSRKKWILIGIVLLAVSLLTGCEGLSLRQILPGTDNEPLGEAMVEVTFFVQVPQNTPEGDIIYLSTLDEVTGLGVNATAYPLEPALGEENLDQGLVYKTTLVVPQGSIIKYRYTRQNQYAVIEHTEADVQVRYRMALADHPLEIRDVVSKWSDTSYYWPQAGRISGVISNAATGEPVPGMLVSGGGVQTFTTASGTYQLPGLPPGVHNLVVYAPDGSFQEIQQGAEVASQANTEANLAISARDYVDVTFLVTVPIGTPENSVRLAGNLYQLGNTFGNLPGGMNSVPARMPQLLGAGDNTYGIILSLPVGAEIRYKYSLGDGFWNAEHEEDGSFTLRRFIVPEQPIQINDQVLTWKSGSKDSITFDLWTPENTPAGENVYIQFNPYGWTTPLPMTEISENHWVFILFSPFDILSELTYRYCREGECGIADDASTAGAFAEGRSVSASSEAQYIADSVDDWIWLEDGFSDLQEPLPVITSRGDEFVTGIEILPGQQAADSIQVGAALGNLSNLNSNWAFLTPTWSVSNQIPPVIEPNPNQDPLWNDINSMSRMATEAGLMVALHPQVHIAIPAEEWWSSSPRDFGWWNSWFDQYKTFAIHFAETAQKQNAEMLVLGGDWIRPALPGGKLANGEPSGVPADAELRWIEIMQDVRARFSGQIAWLTSLPVSSTPPGFIDNVDFIYVNWTPDLEISSTNELEEMVGFAQQSLEEDVKFCWENWANPNGKKLFLRISYPSVQGWKQTCEEDDPDPCYHPDKFIYPAPLDINLETGFAEQALAYQILLSTTTRPDWISGVVIRGYYAPAVLHDKSISIHGKPAEIIIRDWFMQLK